MYMASNYLMLFVFHCSQLLHDYCQGGRTPSPFNSATLYHAATFPSAAFIGTCIRDDISRTAIIEVRPDFKKIRHLDYHKPVPQE